MLFLTWPLRQKIDWDNLKNILKVQIRLRRETSCGSSSHQSRYVNLSNIISVVVTYKEPRILHHGSTWLSSTDADVSLPSNLLSLTISARFTKIAVEEVNTVMGLIKNMKTWYALPQAMSHRATRIVYSLQAFHTFLWHIITDGNSYPINRQ